MCQKLVSARATLALLKLDRHLLHHTLPALLFSCPAQLFQKTNPTLGRFVRLGGILRPVVPRRPCGRGVARTGGMSAGSSAKYSVLASAKRVSETGGSNGRAGQTGGESDLKRPRGVFRLTRDIFLYILKDDLIPSIKVASSTPEKKVFPLFTRKVHKEAMETVDFQWHESLGTDKTCLKATYKNVFQRDIDERRENSPAKGKAKIACFDLDGCLIRPKNGKSFPSASDEYDYEEAFKGAFNKVKEEHEKGSSIVIVSNQKQNAPGPSKKLATWKSKVQHIAQAIDCPMMIIAALSDDGFRKPGRLAWDRGIVPAYIEAGGKMQNIEIQGTIESQASFFVGDAAGRIGDHNDTDRKWAANVGIPFYTPEEYFRGEKPRKYTLSGFKPTAFIGEEDQLPSNYFPHTSSTLDLVLFVGPPAAGKTTFYKKHFSHRDYQWVNQDTLKTAAKCLSAARMHLSNNCSVVVDNTNRNRSTRAPYIALARELKANIRCVFFDIPQELCEHNSFYRVRAGLQPPEEERKVLPGLAFSSYFNNLEAPSKDEGFDADIVTVKWSFHGDAEAKRRWLMYWQ